MEEGRCREEVLGRRRGEEECRSVCLREGLDTGGSFRVRRRRMEE